MSERKKFYKREDLVGKMVVNQDAKQVGSVKDTAYDSEGKMALLVARKEGDEKYFSINDVKSIGDIVLLKEGMPQAVGAATTPLSPQAPQPPQAVAPAPQAVAVAAPTQLRKTCAKCGHSNPPTAKFCVKCGNPL